MAELCSFFWESIVSKASCGSQDFSDLTDFVQIYRTYVTKYYLVKRQVFEFFLNSELIFDEFFVNKRRKKFLLKKLFWFSR